MLTTKNQPLLLAILLILSVANSTLAFATEQPSIGSVIMVQGKVYAQNLKHQTRILQRRSKIYLKDIIVTSNNSKVQLRLNDDSIVVLQPQSQFSVSSFSFDRKAPQKNKYVGNIVKGALTNISGQGKADNYQLKSPLAAITFRGTGIYVNLITKNNLPISQEVNVFKGYVTIQSICAPGTTCRPQITNVGVGQKITAATIDITGRIKASKNPALPSSLTVNKTMTKDSKGTILLQCETTQ